MVRLFSSSEELMKTVNGEEEKHPWENNSYWCGRRDVRVEFIFAVQIVEETPGN